jgi:hypothetical protein
LKIVEGIDNATAQLAINRSGAIGAMLLERATGQAEEARSLWGAEIAWRGVESRW